MNIFFFGEGGGKKLEIEDEGSNSQIATPNRVIIGREDPLLLAKEMSRAESKTIFNLFTSYHMLI